MYITVTTTMTSKNTGASMWFIMEVPENDLLEVEQLLADRGMIHGWRVDTRRDGEETYVKSRIEHLVMKDAIATIRPSHIDF